MFKNLVYIYISATLFLFTNTVSANQYPSRPANGIVHVKLINVSGIGNRIKNIISHLRYFQPKHINLYWDSEGWVSSKFFDLFAPTWNVSITEYNSHHQIYGLFTYREHLYPYIDTYSLLVTEEDFKNKKHQFIDNKYNDIPQEIIKTYTPYFQNLHPSKQVKQRITQVKLPSKYVSVFIRNAPDWKKYFNGNEEPEVFFKIMDKFPKDTIFYLSALSKETAQIFHIHYPNRIIELPNKDYSSMIDAVADMYILGKGNTAIYSIGSTFAEVAWWLGGAKQKVIKVGSTNHWRPYFNKKQLQILPKLPD